MPGTSNSGGRNKLSTRMHLLKGTFQPSRHGDHETPEPPTGRPEAPKTITDHVARAEWDRMVVRLEETGTITRVDDGALYQYAQLFAETEGITVRSKENEALAKKLMKEVRALEGKDLVDAVKAIVELRYLQGKDVRDLRQGHMAIRGYLVEFGMTPAARTRVKLPSKPRQSKVDKFRAGA